MEKEAAVIELTKHLETARKKMFEELNSSCLDNFNKSINDLAKDVANINEADYTNTIGTFRNLIISFLKRLERHHNVTWRKLLESYDQEKRNAILNSVDLTITKKSTHMHKD